jgi:choice-of-anchor C domain-containing protein
LVGRLTMRIRTLVIALAITSTTLAHAPAGAAAAHPGILRNGNFEIPAIKRGTVRTYQAPGHLRHWHVTAGSIDLLDRVWRNGRGWQSIDLSGFDAGTIAQSVPTVAGQTYVLRFAMAGNPDGGPPIKQMRVRWGSDVVAEPEFDTTGRNDRDMGWAYLTYRVTADAATMTLSFESLTDGMFGPALDDVTVTAE